MQLVPVQFSPLLRSSFKFKAIELPSTGSPGNFRARSEKRRFCRQKFRLLHRVSDNSKITSCNRDKVGDSPSWYIPFGGEVVKELEWEGEGGQVEVGRRLGGDKREGEGARAEGRGEPLDKRSITSPLQGGTDRKRPCSLQQYAQ